MTDCTDTLTATTITEPVPGQEHQASLRELLRRQNQRVIPHRDTSMRPRQRTLADQEKVDEALQVLDEALRLVNEIVDNTDLEDISEG